MAKHLDTQINIENSEIPLRVYVERRDNVRIAVGKKHVILRLPKGLNSREVEKYMDWAEDWVVKQYHSNDILKTRYTARSYKNGDTLEILGRVYTVYISETQNKSHGGKIEGTNILLKLSSLDNNQHKQQAIKHILSRLLSHSFLPYISKRVHELNDKFFKKPIANIKMKYNKSNWGSCSSKGNVNLSSRLLFAPPDVIDYVIIHELAHLIEMNHSPRFWQLVANAMPNYKEKEKWLKLNGADCDF